MEGWLGPVPRPEVAGPAFANPFPEEEPPLPPEGAGGAEGAADAVGPGMLGLAAT